MNNSLTLKLLAGTAALALPLMASAASTYTTGTGTLTAAATVNFQVVIQKTLFLRVGTGSAYASGTPTTVATTDLITFSPALGSTGTAVAGVGGDLGTGTAAIETAAVVSNGGSTVTLVANTNTNGLSDGAATPSYIPFTQITTAATKLNSATPLPAPTLANGTSNTVTLTATNKVINQDAQWTYTYANSVTYPGGTYGGTTNNGTVTYTATMP
jgi:hypothetical protein